MTLLATAIRAGCAAAPHFVLNRKPELAKKCRDFLGAYPESGAEPLYIHAQQTPLWAHAGTEVRSAWEIFRATLLILARTEREEADKRRLLELISMRAQPQAARRIPDWMRGQDEDMAPGLGDLIAPLRRPAPPPAAAPVPASVSVPVRKGPRKGAR